MRERWTLYKTYKEWHDECGLTDRQVKKGRKKLRELSLVSEKKGPHGRLHYRVDWPALARALRLDAVADQTEELDDWFNCSDGEDSLDAVGVLGQFGHQGDQGSSDAVGVHANTGEYAGDYEQDNSLLQSGAEPAFAESAPTPKNKNKEPKEVYLSSLPNTDKRHSQVLEPPRPKLSGEVEHKVWALIYGLPNATAVTRFADHFITNRLDGDGEAFTVERVAEKVREQLGGKEPLEAYTPFVRRCLEGKRAELEPEEVAS
jgi:hypothetical protein